MYYCRNIRQKVAMRYGRSSVLIHNLPALAHDFLFLLSWIVQKLFFMQLPSKQASKLRHIACIFTAYRLPSKFATTVTLRQPQSAGKCWMRLYAIDHKSTHIVARQKRARSV